MTENFLKVPKKLKDVALWVHPEGRVLGALYLRTQSVNHAGEEEPGEILNQKEPFIVVKRVDPEELRFYNLSSIIRVEYDEEYNTNLPNVKHLNCQLHMMDGSLIAGIIKAPMPPDMPRLLDYLNKHEDRFVKMYIDDTKVYLVNKSYIIRATSMDTE